MSTRSDEPPDLTDPFWVTKLDHGRVQTLWYSDGAVHVRHECHRQRDGLTLIIAPALQLGHGHSIVTRDPLTVSPSIACGDCGLHGWIRDGRWTDA